MSFFSPKPRPVLLPLGWPNDADEREAFTRVLLAAGADVERMLDPAIGTADAFLRHAARMPFLKNGRETPLVAFAPTVADAEPLLELRQRMLEAIQQLRAATWLVYIEHSLRPAFIKSALTVGGTFDAGGGLVTWHVALGPIGLVSGETWLAGLHQRLDELLEPTLESGVMPAEPPSPHSQLHHIPTTEPAPSGAVFDEDSAYAAIARGSLSPTRGRPSMAPGSGRSSSSIPPNPRLRRG